MKENRTFEDRKQAVLNAAWKQGIVDVVTSTRDGVSPETVALAVDLMKLKNPPPMAVVMY
jgi:hypothetical protein